jgi:hypothetical protein
VENPHSSVCIYPESVLCKHLASNAIRRPLAIQHVNHNNISTLSLEFPPHQLLGVTHHRHHPHRQWECPRYNDQQGLETYTEIFY